MDPWLAELWLRMTADALQGAEGARGALGALGQHPMSPTALEAWMKLWLPEVRQAGGEVPTAQVADFHRLLEDWWRLLGVVPQYRYDELDRRYGELKRRLEDAERTVVRLRRALAREGGQAEAREMLDTWEDLTQQTLAAQTEWTRRWLDAWKTAPGGGDDDTSK